MPFIKKAPVAAALAASTICLIAYLSTLSCGFVYWDDPYYVLDNPLIKTLDTSMLLSAFTEPHVGWWMPLTWLSLAIDYHLWGLNPVGYHLTNLLLHALNTALVVGIAHRLFTVVKVFPEENREAAGQRLLSLLLAGLFFGLHPLRVESVAWVTERKDVLNGFFTLGSIYFYTRHAERQVSGREGGLLELSVSLVLFCLSLMAKSISVVLPLMLLVLDWYPFHRLTRGSVKRVLVEKVPFVAASGIMSAVTLHFTAKSDYLVNYELFPFSQRLIVSGNALFEYCRLILLPWGILPLHMIPDPIPGIYTVKATGALVMFVVCLYAARKRQWVGTVGLTFLLPTLPVLAFFQNGDQAFAARFTYLPSVAVSIAGAALCGTLAGKARLTSFVRGAAVVVIIWYGIATLQQIRYWENTITLWTRVIQVDPHVVAYKERGNAYLRARDYAAAIADYSEGIKIASGVFRGTIYNLYAFRGEAYLGQGDYQKAVDDFSTAINLYPHTAFLYHRGLALMKLGRAAEASEDFKLAGPEPGTIEWYY